VSKDDVSTSNFKAGAAEPTIVGYGSTGQDQHFSHQQHQQRGFVPAAAATWNAEHSSVQQREHHHQQHTFIIPYSATTRQRSHSSVMPPDVHEHQQRHFDGHYRGLAIEVSTTNQINQTFHQKIQIIFYNLNTIDSFV
jgi:hypothetical protein